MTELLFAKAPAPEPLQDEVRWNVMNDGGMLIAPPFYEYIGPVAETFEMALTSLIDTLNTPDTKISVVKVDYEFYQVNRHFFKANIWLHQPAGIHDVTWNPVGEKDSGSHQYWAQSQRWHLPRTWQLPELDKYWVLTVDVYKAMYYNKVGFAFKMQRSFQPLHPLTSVTPTGNIQVSYTLAPNTLTTRPCIGSVGAWFRNKANGPSFGLDDLADLETAIRMDDYLFEIITQAVCAPHNRDYLSECFGSPMIFALYSAMYDEGSTKVRNALASAGLPADRMVQAIKDNRHGDWWAHTSYQPPDYVALTELILEGYDWLSGYPDFWVDNASNLTTLGVTAADLYQGRTLNKRFHNVEPWIHYDKDKLVANLKHQTKALSELKPK